MTAGRRTTSTAQALKKIITPAAPAASAPPRRARRPGAKPLTIDIPEILPGIDPPPIKLPGVLGDLLDPNKSKSSSDKAGTGLLGLPARGNR